jgi:hypothetical protein
MKILLTFVALATCQ